MSLEVGQVLLRFSINHYYETAKLKRQLNKILKNKSSFIRSWEFELRCFDANINFFCRSIT
jgi:hypothetical protein